MSGELKTPELPVLPDPEFARRARHLLTDLEVNAPLEKLLLGEVDLWFTANPDQARTRYTELLVAIACYEEIKAASRRYLERKMAE